MNKKQFFRLVNTLVVFSMIIYISTIAIGRFKTIRETVQKKEDEKIQQIIESVSGMKTDLADLRNIMNEIKKQGL